MTTPPVPHLDPAMPPGTYMEHVLLAAMAHCKRCRMRIAANLRGDLGAMKARRRKNLDAARGSRPAKKAAK